MNLVQKRHIALATLLTSLSISTAMASSCRSTVDLALESMGEKKESLNYSSVRFEDLNITPKQFNNLTLAEQEEIYHKVKPLKSLAQETSIKLERYINRYMGSSYEMDLTEEIELWKSLIEKLKVCS